MVAVVGGAGFIGRAVVQELQRRGAQPLIVDRVGVDPLDITEPDAEARLAARFARADVRVVVHLAARINPVAHAAEREAARRLHEDGTRAVLRAARTAGATRFVLVSSATVYGAHPDNPVPLDERAPVRPNAFSYAQDKRAQENITMREGAGLSIAIARPAIVFGADARSYLTEIIVRAPFLPALDGAQPPLQFAHVSDVATGLVALVLAPAEVQGPFNLGPVDWLPFAEVARIARKRLVALPARLLAPILDAGARVLPAHLRAPAAMMPYLTHPFVICSRRLTEQTGWQPRWSSEQALREVLQR